MFVQKSNLVPPNFDVGYPMNPLFDPTYIRQDIDVVSILQEDSILELETMDKDIINEIETNKNVPWYTCEDLPPGEAGFWVDGDYVVDKDSNDNQKKGRRNKKQKIVQTIEDVSSVP
jgi:hypothetical protein